jgi:hypothetical protein
MRKLDKSKDYGDVFPPENGAHYMQGSFYYDQHGDIVTHPALFDEAAAVKLKRLESLEKANEAAADARRKALEADGLSAAEIDAAQDESDKDADKGADKKLDLRAWLRGEKMIFPHVQKAIQDQHGYNAINKRQAVEFLVGELGLVDPSDVKV